MKEIEKRLAENGVRPTAMRILIYKYLAEREVAIALTDMENAFSKADRTTLYRTLKTFEEKRIVHQIDDGTNISKYALCEPGCNCEMEQDLHLHFQRHLLLHLQQCLPSQDQSSQSNFQEQKATQSAQMVPPDQETFGLQHT
ncbi:MAG: transcriptional repressor, partial [Bacteroidota bacterium]|nr:transcriptional repressor [Bacteroidota bacterium]